MTNSINFLKCLHEETAPTGTLGRGTHYSVYRAVIWHDESGRPLETAKLHDFAIIWDEDHDERIFTVIQKIYLSGFLSSLLFIGERKGGFTALMSDEAYKKLGNDKRSEMRDQIAEFTAEVNGDSWSAELHHISSQEHSIIQDDGRRVHLYLENLKMLWELGSKDAGEYFASDNSMHQAA